MIADILKLPQIMGGDNKRQFPLVIFYFIFFVNSRFSDIPKSKFLDFSLSTLS